MTDLFKKTKKQKRKLKHFKKTFKENSPETKHAIIKRIMKAKIPKWGSLRVTMD